MFRYKLTLEYDGGGFVGWQRQDNGLSVQEALENALGRFCGHPVTVVGAGRTDAGVHARAQVAHVDLDREWPADTVRAAANFHLKPAAVAVIAAEPADPDFHARFSASERVYFYRILNRVSPPVLERGRAWWVPMPLSERAMADAAQSLVGHHDYSAFRSSMCQAASPKKSINAIDVIRDGELLSLEVRARSFLHNQVRIIAGTLKKIGERKWTAAHVQKALMTGERTFAGPTAPAHGLYLMNVHYQPSPGRASSVQPVGDRTDE